MPGFAAKLLGRDGPFSAWGKSASPRIFLSYRRRGEGAGFAARLADRLVQHFGAAQIFRDVEDIESGVDFVEAIRQAVSSCEMLIVVIGTDWLEMKDASGRRRLEDPRDFVRLEIAAALQRNIRVVPVLVCGATIPPEEQLPADIAGLSRRQAHELSDSRWDYDIGQLIKSIESIGIRPSSGASAPPASATKRRFYRKPAVIAGGIGLAVVVALLGQYATNAGGLDGPGGDSFNNSATSPAQGALTPPNPGGKTGLLDVSQSAVQAADPKQQADVKSASTDEPPNAQLSSAAHAEAGALQVLAQSGETRVYAEQAMDPNVLTRNYTGVALQYMVGRLQYLASKGEISIGTLHAQNIRAVQLSPNLDYATIDFEETWSADHINTVTRQCAHRLPLHTIPQRAMLVRLTGPWMIYGLEIAPYQEPQAVYC